MIYTIFIIPITILLIGYFMFKYPPKKINYIIGYRTPKSMKDERNWKEANKYCSKIMIRLGIITIIISIILLLLELLNIIRITEELLVVITIIQVLLLFIPIILTENKLKDNIMKKYLKEIIILLIQLYMFYIFPLFAGPTDTMGMVFLIIASTFILSLILGIISKNKLKYLYPVITSLVFIPSIFIYYNESALIHSIWYLIDSFIGLIIGLIISRLFN